MTTAAVGSVELRRSLARVENQRRGVALTLTLPLLVFLLFVFFVPIAALLTRAVENPEIADSLPRTSKALNGWDGRSAPPARVFLAVAADLGALPEIASAGAVARRLNSEVPGSRSLIMGTYRALPLGEGLAPDAVRDKMLELDPRWGELPYWQAIAKNVWWSSYFGHINRLLNCRFTLESVG